jgi:predicted RNase H-like nuclease
MTRLCGVDGCKYGWFALLCAENFSNVEWRLARDWTGLGLAAETVAVDMPIGLSTQGRRGCDEAARKAPNLRRSSIFPMPVREALNFERYAEANAWSKANGHGGIVKQAWNLRAKVLDLEQAVLNDPSARIFEAHPELAFARLANGPLAAKKTTDGRNQRLNLLNAVGVTGIERLLSAIPRARAASDDVIDAAVLLLTAQRIHMGLAVHYPCQPLINGQGMPMRIWV